MTNPSPPCKSPPHPSLSLLSVLFSSAELNVLERKMTLGKSCRLKEEWYNTLTLYKQTCKPSSQRCTTFHQFNTSDLVY